MKFPDGKVAHLYPHCIEIVLFFCTFFDKQCVNLAVETRNSVPTY